MKIYSIIKQESGVVSKNEKLKNPVRKKWWFWTIIVAGAIFIIYGFSHTKKVENKIETSSSQELKNKESKRDAEKTESNSETQPSSVPTQINKSSEQTTNPGNARQLQNSDATLSQQNAIKKAESYLECSGFSHSGLIKQLEFEKFSLEDATYAADNCGADWNEQAVRKAKSYLECSSFSAQGLIDQLKYEGFTQEQAEYAIKSVGF